MVEQEYEDKKIARQAKINNEKLDNRQMQVLQKRQEITNNLGEEYKLRLLNKDKITKLDRLRERQNDHHFGQEIRDKGYPVLKQLSYQQVLK